MPRAGGLKHSDYLTKLGNTRTMNVIRETKKTAEVADQPTGVNRDYLKELLREIVAEEAPVSALHDVEPGTTPKQPKRVRDEDLAQKFIHEVTTRPKPRSVTVNLSAAIRKLEAAEKVLGFMNPDLEGKTRKWGRNPQSRKEALALANHCVKEALSQLRVKRQASLN